MQNMQMRSDKTRKIKPKHMKKTKPIIGDNCDIL